MISTLLVCASLIASDGDSLNCDGQRLRLLGGGIVGSIGVDAPEIGSRAKCEKERKLALTAKRRLAELVSGKVRIEVKGSDSFGRPLVNVYLPDDREVGAILMKEGHAREWRKGVRNDWCD